MNDLLAVAAEILALCDRKGWESCLIGGLAVLRWGEPRVTKDVDIALLTGFGSEDEFIASLLKTYSPRRPDAAQFARRNRVLLIQSSAGIGIDVSLGALPFEKRVIERATAFSFEPGITVRTCSAEDLIVLKLFASRPLDIRDVQGVIIRQQGRLDWRYIENQLRPLAELKEEPEILDTLRRLRTSVRPAH